ncbi:MAG: hypothetical protein IT381_27765 [Deltaproteobacteria bacterium]|nr:hypothetical protein [Deltaproteobacteria bacterium]
MRARVVPALFVGLISCTAVPGGESKLNPSTPPQAASSRVSLAGSAFIIAPIKGAHVKVTRLANKPEVVGETVTGDDGAWGVEFEAVDGDLLVEVLGDRGGSCIEPVTGVAPIPLSQDDRLLTIVANTRLGEQRIGVTINPWTTLIAARTLAKAKENPQAAWTKNSELFSAHFGSFSPWDATPIDLVLKPASGLSSSALYSFSIFALSQHAVELGRRAGVTDVSVVNTLSLLRVLVRDIEDQTFDGKFNDAQLSPLSGNVYVDVETTRASLARALEEFLSSENNKSGFGARDLTKLLSAIRFDKSELYPAGEPDIDRDPTEESGSPPAISIIAPTKDQIVGQGAKVTIEVFDVDGVSEANVKIDGLFTNVSFDRTDSTKWRAEATLSVTDGAHVLEVMATDAKKNTAKASVNFTRDASPPAISYLSCRAPNDLLRTVTTTAGGATFAATTPEEPCLEPALDSGDQQFHVYADLLASDGADTPLVALSVTDSSELASVTCQLQINGNAIGSPAPCIEGATPASHVLPISAPSLGKELLALDVTDSVSVRVVAIDSLGNTGERVFSFRVHVLPTPILAAAAPVTPQYALTSFSFAADNVANLFTPTNFPDYLVELNAYQVTNVSARPTKLSLTAGFDNDFAQWTRRTYVTPYQLYQGFTVPEGAGVCSNGQALKFLRFGTTNYHTCVTPQSLTRVESMQTGYIPTFPFDIRRTVYAANGTKLVADDKNEVILEPGQSYRVVLGTRYPYFTGSSSDTRCEAAFGPEWINHASHGTPDSPGGFYKKHLFFHYIMEGATYSFYGYLSCRQNMTYYCPSGTCSFDALVSNGAVYPVSYARIERELSFNTSATWTPRIHLPTSSASIPARADRSGLAILQQYKTENVKPPEGLGFSLAGW